MSKRNVPPIREKMYTDDGIMARSWVHFFEGLSATSELTYDSDIETAMETQTPDMSAPVDEIETDLLFAREAKSYDQAIEDIETEIAMIQTIDPTWGNRLKAIEQGLKPIAVGGIYVSIDSTNPATTLGYGTWSAFGTGRVMIGIDPGDVDFDVPEETGGAKTHKHSVDVGNTTSGAPSATVNAVTTAGVTAVGTGTHTHDTNPAAVDSTTVSNLPPFIAVYLFKRLT